ncbi:MAG: serine/threonine protein kinase [Myxococcales bacterium]|nr:serine/threonine protein kinase [Myxococcales bacterium]
MQPPAMTTIDASGELGERLQGARADASGLEAAQMLGSLRERLFGIASEPPRVGRFVVLRRLGAGGMGVVYLAYDAELDRKIAVKILRARGDDRGAARLLREARALARVDHPNVIAVHEVGEHEGAVFIAMELVQGDTLRRWQETAPRPWREIVEVYIEAGRGLAAAHAAGVVHRDFKPDNVLVSEAVGGGRHRVRVGDFGLALASDGDGDGDGDPTLSSKDMSEGTSSSSAASGSSLTRSGALLGTPAYMSPEQLRGRRVDARSDLFAFGLALHEAIFGARAFAGDDADALVAAVLAGRRRPLPAGARAPRWLRRVIDRALEVEPERRYPSMTALLGDLEAGLRRSRRRRLAAGAAALAIGAALGGAAFSQGPGLCAPTHAEAALAEVWNDGARAAGAAAFARTGRPFAAPAWAQVERRVDAYADAWRSAYVGACEATHVRGAQSGEALDLRMRCLDRRREELGALVDLFAAADERAVLHAVEASDALTPIQRCADTRALATSDALPIDPGERASARALQAELARAKALRDAGHYDEALALARPTHEAALELGFGPLRTDTGVILGGLQALAGAAPDEATATLDQAFVDGLASGHAEGAAWAAIIATHVVGVLARHSAEGRRWAHLAAPLLERIGGGDPRARASLHNNLGTLALVDGELAEARDHIEEAVAIIEAAYGPDDVMIARMIANLAAAHRRSGEHAEALAAYRRARAIFTLNLGPDHPALATLANNTGVLLQTMGDLEGAERAYREVLAFAGAGLPEQSPTLGHAHANLGELLLLEGRGDEALPHDRAAIAIWERTRGPKHPLVALALVNLASAQIATGAAGEALASLQRAIEIYRESDASPGELAAAQFELARAMVLAAPNERDDAIGLAERALPALQGDASERASAWLAEQRAAP